MLFFAETSDIPFCCSLSLVFCVLGATRIISVGRGGEMEKSSIGCIKSDRCICLCGEVYSINCSSCAVISS